MESIADILSRVKALSLKSSTAVETLPELIVCSACGGQGWLSANVDIYDERFGKVWPCTQCATPRGSFFDALKVTEDNEAAMEASVEMAYRPRGWLVIVGPKGTGKTTMLKAIASEWYGSEQHPFTAVGLLDYWKEAVGDERSWLFQQRFQSMCEATVFALDDLAAPKVTDWAVERLTELLDFRYARELPTVITTDHDEQQLADVFGSRLADRVFDQLTGLSKIVTVGGASWRTGRMW